jgi:four helix bundle protein
MEVWRFAHQARLTTLLIIPTIPADERFNLSSQMRPAALSVPANIVEGFRRRKAKDKMRFYNISQASLGELSHFNRVAREAGYISGNLPVFQNLESIDRMLTKLIRKTPNLPSCS